MEETVFIGVTEIQEKYLPIGKKKIRKILNSHPGVLDVKRNGNRLLVNRQQFLEFVSNPEMVELN